MLGDFEPWVSSPKVGGLGGQLSPRKKVASCYGNGKFRFDCSWVVKEQQAQLRLQKNKKNFRRKAGQK